MPVIVALILYHPLRIGMNATKETENIQIYLTF
jgi:hypothetical protein